MTILPPGKAMSVSMKIKLWEPFSMILVQILNPLMKLSKTVHGYAPNPTV